MSQFTHYPANNAFNPFILLGSTSGTITFQAPAVVTSYTLTFPATQGGANTFLKNDGSGGLSWATGSGAGGFDSIGTFDTGTVSVNGLNATGTTLFAQSADATHPGMVNIGTQSFAGNKTFTGTIAAANLSGTNTGDVTLGTASGLSLSGQVLSLQLSDTSHTGALSSTDWNTFNGKQAALTIGNLTDVGTDGITVTGGTGAVIGSGTSIAQHVADASHNGYLSSTDWSTFNGKQAAGNYLTALTGDGVAAGPGSSSLTLATVNSNVGSFGSSTAIAAFTVNGKGLITAASSSAVIAPAGTLTGTTLAANVVSSSLTSVGTITSGTWTGTTIALANGGTGQTSKAPAFDALSPMTTGGDLIYGGASGTGTRLANGTAGQVLTSGGGTAAPTWSFAGVQDSASDLQNFALAVSFSAGAMTVAIKTKAGNDPSATDPVSVAFLTSITSGTYVVRTITAATSLVVTSGAQLGGSNAVAQTIYFYLMDNSGTVEVAVAGYRLYDDWDQVTSTTMSAASDDGATLYSTTGRSNLMSRCVGYMTSTQTTSGTWAQSPTVLKATTIRASLVERVLGQQTSATNFPSTNTYGDATNVVLTPGVWQLTSFLYASNVTTESTVTQFRSGISTTSGNSGTGLVGGTSEGIVQQGGGLGQTTISIAPVQFSPTVVTTHYQKIRATYTSTAPQYQSNLAALRVR